MKIFLNTIKFSGFALILFLGVFLFGKFSLAQSANIIFEDTPLFSGLNILPGDKTTKWVKVTNNTGELQSAAVQVDSYIDNGLGDRMEIAISEGGALLYQNTLDNFFIDGEIFLSDIQIAVEKQYDFTVSFLSIADNNYQGKSLIFDISVGLQDEEIIGEDDGGGEGGGFFTYTGQGETREIVVLGEEGVPELTLDLDCDKEIINPGDKVICKVKVENIGSLTAFNVVLDDKLSEGLKFVDKLINNKTWNLGDMAPWEFSSIEYLLSVDEDAKSGIYLNTAYAHADNAKEVSDQVDLELKNIFVLGMELIDTGFSNKEFIILIITILSLLLISWCLRKKYFTNIK